MNLDPQLTTYIPKLSKYLGVEDHCVDVAFLAAIIVVGLVSVVVVFGLIDTVSIVDVGLKSV